MSALARFADSSRTSPEVREVPSPVVSRCSKRVPVARLFDHLVGAGEQRKRECETKRVGSFEVDDQLDFHRLLNRQVSWFGTVENPTCVDADLPIDIGKIDAIAHEPARSREPAVRINRWNGITRRGLDESSGSVGE